MLPGWLIEILLLVKIIAKIIDKQQNRFCFSELKKNNLLLKVKLRLHEANDQSKKNALQNQIKCENCQEKKVLKLFKTKAINIEMSAPTLNKVNLK